MFPCACTNWCGREKNRIHVGLAQHWPVHINLTSSFVQPCVCAFSNAALWTMCSIQLTETSSKSVGFIKCWPKCLNPNVAEASQSQRTHEAISDACLYLLHSGLFTSPCLCRWPFIWQCLVSSPITCTWFILKLSNSLAFNRGSFKEALSLPLSMNQLPILRFPTHPGPDHLPGNLCRYVQGMLRSCKWIWGALSG